MIQIEKRTSGLVPSDLYFNGQKIYLDVDEDSYLYAPSDDVLALILGGSVKATWNANGLRVGDTTASTVSLEAANGLTVAAGMLTAGQIQGISATNPPILSQRTSAVTNSVRGALRVEHKTSGDMVDGFGADLFFQLTDSAFAAEVGSISAVRAGADVDALARFKFNKGIQFSRNGETAVPIGTIAPVLVSQTYTGTLFDAAALTDSATIWTQPANTTLMAIVMRLTTQFAGPSLTDMRVTMGLAGDPDGLLTTTGNLISDAAATEYANVGAYYATFLAGLHGPTAAAIPWVAYAAATGCDMDDLTAGQLDFYVLYLEP